MIGHLRLFSVALCAAAVWVGAARATTSPQVVCEVAKDKAAGKKAACIMTQRTKEVKGKIPDYASCSAKFSATYAKAEFKAHLAGASCPTTGDAARIEARIDAQYDPDTGIPKILSGVRFLDNLDGTVTDTQTGLMWETKNSLNNVVDLNNPHDGDNLYSWSTATTPNGTAFTDFLDKLNNCTSSNGSVVTGGFAGYCDWRLPGVAELRTLILVPCSIGPCINSAYGPTRSGIYWSATVVNGNPSAAYGVDFSNGQSTSPFKTQLESVRAVRGGI